MKKIKLYLFTLLSVMIVGIMNVNAEEVANEEQLKDCLATANNICKLDDNFELLGPITITEKNVTIDLNGKKISYETSVAGEAMITNKGELTITDSSDLAQGKITFKYVGEPDSSFGKGNYTISNVGTLLVKNGTIENTTDKMSHACYAIDNNSINSASTLTVDGGKVININNYAIRQIAGLNQNNATINGGTVSGTRAVWVQLAGSKDTDKPNMKLNITGGNVIGTGESEDYKLAIYSYSYGNSLENVEINISGGTIEGDVALSGGNNKTISEILNITGGNFTSDYGVYSYVEDENARLEISGGTFNTEIYEYYLATNVVSKKIGETYTVGKEHTVTIGTVTAGKVEVDKAKAIVGETVALTLTPNEGYELSKIEVKDANGKTVEVKDNAFVMPDAAVTITAVYTKVTATTEIPVVSETTEVEEVVVGVKDADKVEDVLLESLKENEELAEIAEDKSVKVVVEIESVKEADIDKDVVDAMKEEAGKTTIAEFFDINILVKDVLNNTNLGNITELTEEIELMILLPEELKKSEEGTTRKYYVVRHHEDEVELLEAKVSEDGKYLVFKTDRFSTYALAYEDVAATPNTPQTGDSIGLYIILGLISVAAIGLSLNSLNRRKKFN